MKLSHSDELLLHRFLDGEIAAAEVAAFEARLGAEPLLRQRLEQQRALRAGFAAHREGGAVPATAPATGFTARVLAAARRLPSRQQMDLLEAANAWVRTCQRLLVAAAIVFGIGMAWHSGLFDGGRADTLQAAPDEIEQEMKRLDSVADSLPGRGHDAVGERRGK
jgi:anti-sigma factor RsiW